MHGAHGSFGKYLGWFARDLRLAGRLLIREWRFTVVATLTVAAGIAGVTAFFAIVSGVILRPLPYRDADRLVMANAWTVDYSYPRGESRAMHIASIGDDWRERNLIFEDITVGWAANAEAMDVAAGESVDGAAVLPNFFSLLGVAPEIGRDFTEADTQGSESVSIILSHSLWQRRFAGNPEILGTTLAGGRVIGVMPAGVSVPGGLADYWIAIDPQPRYGGWTWGRLRNGITIAEAQRNLTNLVEQVDAEYGREGFRRMVVEPISQTETPSRNRTLLLLLTGAAGGLLLIALVNVANLVLGRSVSRRHEFQLRAALGMSRWQMVRQLLAENILFTAVGGISGLWLAYVVLDLIVANLGQVPRIRYVSVDLTVVVFVSLVTLVASCAFSVLPALTWSGPSPDDGLRGGSNVTAGRCDRILRRFLISAQIAIASVLLIGTAFAGKSFWNILHVPLGFDANGLVVARLEFPEQGGAGGLPMSVYDRVADALQGISSMGSASFTSGLPAVGNRTEQITVPGVDVGPNLMAWAREVTGGYFETLGIPLLIGRTFREGEDAVVISEALWRRLWPGDDVVGQLLRVGESDGGPALKVVGVVPDSPVGFSRVQGARVEGAQIFQPCRSCDELIVRPRGDASGVRPAIEAAITNVGASAGISRLRTMDDALYEAEIVSDLRSQTGLFAAFSAIGLLLAMVGVYGTVAHSAAQRVREIGIRLALGATRARVIRGMMGDLITPLTAGLCVGMWIAAGAVQSLQTYLFETDPLDVSIFAVVAATLILAVLVASFGAVWRGTSLSPATSLRTE